MAVSRILIIRLPCHKVFPTGPVYLMSSIHRAAPGVAQKVLDLALVDRRSRAGEIRHAIADFHPDVIAFSWRDMQIFSPQYLDGALRDAFIFFYDSSPARKLRAAFRGSRRFWFADAQLLSEHRDREHLTAILEGIVRLDLPIQWSGYIRIHEIDHTLASLMVRSGLCDLEVSLNSGAQSVLDELKLGFSVDEVMKGFEALKAAGYTGKVLVNLSLNAPGETRDTLLETMETMRRIRRIFGDSQVVPVVFFLAIQPHTGLERKAQANGQIKAGYDPLSVLPWNVIRLIYNPAPLGRLIGRSCAAVFDRGGDHVGDTMLAAIETELKAAAVP